MKTRADGLPLSIEALEEESLEDLLPTAPSFCEPLTKRSRISQLSQGNGLTGGQRQHMTDSYLSAAFFEAAASSNEMQGHMSRVSQSRVNEYSQFPQHARASTPLASQSMARSVVNDIDRLLFAQGREVSRAASVASSTLLVPPMSEVRQVQPRRLSTAAQRPSTAELLPSPAHHSDQPAVLAVTAASISAERTRRAGADAHAVALRREVQARLAAVRQRSGGTAQGERGDGDAASKQALLSYSAAFAESRSSPPLPVAGPAHVQAAEAAAASARAELTACKSENSVLSLSLAKESGQRQAVSEEANRLRQEVESLQGQLRAQAKERNAVFVKRDDIAVESTARLEGQIRELGTALAASQAEAGSLSAQAEDRLRRVNALVARLQSAKADTDAAEGESRRAKAAVSSLEAALAQASANLASAKEEKDKQEARISALSKEIVRLKQNQPSSGPVEGTVPHSSVSHLEQALATSETHLHDLEGQLRQVRDTNADLLATMQQADGSIERLTSALESAEEREAFLAKELGEMQASRTRAVAEMAARMHAAEQEVLSLRSRVDGALNQASEAEARAAGMAQRVESAESRAADAERLSDALRAELMKRDALVSALQNEVQSMASMVQAERGKIDSRPSFGALSLAHSVSLTPIGHKSVGGNGRRSGAGDSTAVASPPSPSEQDDANLDFHTLPLSRPPSHQDLIRLDEPGPLSTGYSHAQQANAHTPAPHTAANIAAESRPRASTAAGASVSAAAVSAGSSSSSGLLFGATGGDPLAAYAPRLAASRAPLSPHYAAPLEGLEGAGHGPPHARTTAPVRAANHKRVFAAVSNVLLAGQGLEKIAAVKRALDAAQGCQVVIALLTSGSKSAGQFAGLYAVIDEAVECSTGQFGARLVGDGPPSADSESRQHQTVLAKRVYGWGPAVLTAGLCGTLFKYDTAARSFSTIGQSSTFTVTTDAVGIDPAHVILVRREDGSMGILAKEGFLQS